MSKPCLIRIFLPDGDPDGLRLIEKSNWSGVGLVIPRVIFATAKQRKELMRTGVYVLVSPAEEGLPRIYVGEGDPIRPRLQQHDAKREWATCFAFTSKDENLNKAHVQYLEARLVELAHEAKRCTLENGNVPARPSMSESDVADAEGFLSEMLLCFPLLGLAVFSRAPVPASSSAHLFLASKGAHAEGRETAEGFVVLAGSTAVAAEVPSCHAYLSELRAVLTENGVLQPSASGLTFAQAYTFASPSTAAGVVLGRAANGRIEWKTKDGRTLKELQEAEVE